MPRRGAPIGAVLLVLVCASSSRAPAEEEDPSPPAARAPTEVVVVTAERGEEPRGETPAAVTVLTRAEIEALPALDLSQLLDFIPGFSTIFGSDAGGTLPMVSMRGFFGGGEVEYVRLIVDGVPAGSIESGLVDWRAIPAERIERVEVLRGPASSVYGDTALGGVIQVFTRRGPGSGPAHGTIAPAAGSPRTGLLDVSYRATTDSARWSASGRLSGAEGSREHSDADRTSVLFTADVDRGRSTWTLTAEGATLHREEPGSLTERQRRDDPEQSDPLFRFDREDSHAARLAGGWAFFSGEAVRMSARLQGRWAAGDQLRTLPLTADLADRALRATTERAVDASFLAERLGGAGSGHRWELRGGADAGFETLDTRYRAVDGAGDAGAVTGASSVERRRVAPFVSGGLELSRRLRTTGSLRWDRFEDSLPGESVSRSAWSHRAGLVARFGDLAEAPVSVFAAWGRAFRAPSLNQLFDPRPFPDFAGGTFTISNSALTPQIARTIEAGVSRAGRLVRAELAAYRTDVSDEIDFDPATFRYVNIGSTRHTGIEAEVRGGWRGFHPFLAGAYTRVTSPSGPASGHQLKNIPRESIQSGVTLDLPRSAGLTVTHRFLGGRFLDDENRFPLPDTSLFDARLRVPFSRVVLTVDVRNLLDDRDAAVGYVLPDSSGGGQVFVFPQPGRLLLVQAVWSY